MHQTPYEFDRFEFDPSDGTLADRESGNSLRLRPKAARLFAALLDRAGRLVERDVLARAVWGDELVVDFDAGLAALLRELRGSLAQLDGDPGMIETLPRRGVRFNPRVQKRPRAAEESNRRRWPGLVALSVLAAAAVVTAAIVLLPGAPGPAPAPGAPWQLALLPLQTADGQRDRIGIVLADTLLAELWEADLDSLELIGRAGMRAYAGRDDVARAVAEDLGVDLLLEGSFGAGPSGWRVDVRLLATPPGRVVWSHSLSGGGSELPISEIAVDVVDRLARDWPALGDELGGSSVSGARHTNFSAISGALHGIEDRSAACWRPSKSFRRT